MADPAPVTVPAAAPALPASPSPDDAHNQRVFWLGAAIIFIALVIVVLLFFVTIPAANKDVLNTVIGLVVGTGFGSVIGFYFGSSSSSKSKDEVIANLTNGPS